MLEDRHTWINPLAASEAAYLYETEWNSQQDMQRYLLLDTCFLPGLARLLPRMIRREDCCALYAGSYEAEGLDAVSPYLVQLPWSATLRQPLCDGLLPLTSGRPMLSLLHSTASLQALAQHLRTQSEAVDTEGTGYLLRLADTRIIATVLKVFTPQQRHRLLAGIACWSYVDRDGCWKHVEGSLRFDPEADTHPFVIDGGQQRHLQRLELPDALLRYVQLLAPILGELACSPAAAHRIIHDCIWRLAPHELHKESLAYRKALAQLRQAGVLGAARTDAPAAPLP